MTESLSEDQINEFKETFDLFASDDGCIIASELGSVMRALGQDPSETELAEFINEIDADGNGIDFPKFLTVIVRNMDDVDTDEEIRDTFRALIEDGNDILTAAEIKQTLDVLGISSDL
ncbi:hypothetical protein GEMRC1_011565 [Eukaryota sp. GEM-RC1]